MPYAQDFHTLCCNAAIERGYPMGTDTSIPSLQPFIPASVSITSIAYGHLEDEATRIFICLFTALVIYVDDMSTRNKECVAVFIQRFLRREKQLDPILDDLANLFLEIPNYYEPVGANIILTSALNFINSNILDCQTQEMKASLHAKRYPEFTRRMSGLADAYAIMIFPRTIPIQKYIQCLPDAINYINYANDVLSFYKEELVRETINHISVFARCHGLSKMKAFEEVANDAAEAHEHVCKILEMDEETYQAWQRFKDGYAWFHTSSERYRLHELMN